MLDLVLKLLESFAKRTEMYVNPVEIDTVQSYLHGLEAGCQIFGLSVSRDVYARAALTRGWTYRATGIVWHMRSNKLDDAAVIQELIAVEAEAFRLAASNPMSDWTPSEVLVHAISDGINVYIRDVLIPRAVADEEAWDAAGADSDLIRLKYEVAATVAVSWVGALQKNVQ